jgi:hypothetical protein
MTPPPQLQTIEKFYKYTCECTTGAIGIKGIKMKGIRNKNYNNVYQTW